MRIFIRRSKHFHAGIEKVILCKYCLSFRSRQPLVTSNMLSSSCTCFRYIFCDKSLTNDISEFSHSAHSISRWLAANHKLSTPNDHKLISFQPAQCYYFRPHAGMMSFVYNHTYVLIEPLNSSSNDQHHMNIDFCYWNLPGKSCIPI